MERHELKVFLITNVILLIISSFISYVIASLMAGSFGIPISSFAFPSFFTIWGFTPLSLYGTIGIFIFYFMLFYAGCFSSESDWVPPFLFVGLVIVCVIGNIVLSQITDSFIYFLSLRDTYIISTSGFVNLVMGYLAQGD